MFPSNSRYLCANNMQVGMLSGEWRENQSLSGIFLFKKCN